MQDVQAGEDSGSLRASSRADRAIHTHAKVTSVTRQMWLPPPPPHAPTASQLSIPFSPIWTMFPGDQGLQTHVPGASAHSCSVSSAHGAANKDVGKGSALPASSGHQVATGIWSLHCSRWPLVSTPDSAAAQP